MKELNFKSRISNVIEKQKFKERQELVTLIKGIGGIFWRTKNLEEL